jgi:hypothetical protein
MGCSGGEAPDTVEWPQGTVLVCAGDPIRADEVDPIAEALKPLGPSFTLPHLRRLALTNVRLPLAAGRAEGGAKRRERARADAEAFSRSVREDGPLPAQEAPTGGGVEVLEGSQDILGVPLWVLVQDLEVGVWSAVSELPGEFVVVRLEGGDGHAQPQRERFTTRVAAFPYVQEPDSLTALALDSTLVVVDPAWEPLVPGFWRHRMQTVNDPNR